MAVSQLFIILSIGLVAGFLSGSMGIGGAIIVIPSLMFFLGFSTHQAQGTSLALMTIPVMLVAAVNYYRQGHVNLKIALIMAFSFVIGGYIGSKLSVSLPEKVIRTAFGIVLFVVSMKMIFGK